MTAFDAVILAGGRATRLGGVDKTALGTARDTLLDRALRAAAGARRRIVVAGPAARRPLPGVLWTTETPRHGGPVPALAAAFAMPGDPAELVVVLAADLPRVEQALPHLLAAVRPAEPLDGWLAVDPDGRDQPLLAVYRTAPLAAAVAAQPGGGEGLPVRRLLDGLRLGRIPLPAELVADIDTPADAVRAGFTVPG